MHRLIFFIIALSVYTSIYFYFRHRYILPLSISNRGKKIWSLLLFLLIVSPILSFVIFILNGRSGYQVAFFAFFLFGIIFTLLPYSIFRDLLLFLYGIKNKLKKAGGDKEITPKNTEISRREFLNQSNLALLSVTGFSLAFGYKEAVSKPHVITHEVPIRGLGKEFDGFKIAQISDVHIGYSLKKDFLTSVVSQVNSLGPDMVAITGDLVDGRVHELEDDTSVLKNLKSRFGSYFVTGNHEYYSGADEWIEELKRLGIKVLVNSNEKISLGSSSIVIAGVPDHREGPVNNHPYEPEKAIENTLPEDIKILLAHEPVSIDRSSRAGYHLMLSGHTHGGQFFPWNLAVGLVFKYASGIHFHDNKMWINVNRGTGYWGPPIRLGVPSEITLLILRPA